MAPGAAPDVVVVGGGLVGAATAYELAGEGASVVLVDRADVGRASDAGAGILSPETITDLPAAVMPLVDAAGGHVAALVEALAADGAVDVGYDRCGSMRIATVEGEDPYFAISRDAAMARHPGVLEDLSSEEATARFPPLGPVRAAMFNPRAARVDGRAITAALTAAGVRRRVIRRDVSCGSIATTGSRVTGVVLDGQAVSCGAVVVAGGAWSDELAAPFGLRSGVQPLRGQIVHLRREGVDSSSWPIVQPVLGFYAVPWPDGRVAVGGTMDDAGFDVRVTSDGVHQLLRETVRVWPGLADATLVEVRVGLRPMGVDELPTIGAVPEVDGLVVATGLGTNGLLLGPLTGRIAAEIVLGRVPTVGVDELSPGRWA